MLTRENVIKKNLIKNFNGFAFQEIPNIPKINLRGLSSDKDFIANTEKILGTFLPLESNTGNSNNILKILWLSPNEWLIEIYKKEDFDKKLLDLKNILNPHNTAITDITENKTILKLSGLHLYKLLSKFMIIDLETILSEEISIAQTIFIKVPVLIVRNHKKNEEENISLYVNRSYAQYIINLLIDGSKNINF